MAYFAKLDASNVVTEIDEAADMATITATCSGTWVECVRGHQDTKLVAEIGFTYDAAKGYFYPPRPTVQEGTAASSSVKTCDSWTLNTTTGVWEPPTPMPNDGNLYTWNETSEAWVSGGSNKPYPSWSWNATNSRWEAPVARPAGDYGDNGYKWNESTNSWDVHTWPD